jgi:hypothetical protein
LPCADPHLPPTPTPTCRMGGTLPAAFANAHTDLEELRLAGNAHMDGPLPPEWCVHMGQPAATSMPSLASSASCGGGPNAPPA